MSFGRVTVTPEQRREETLARRHAPAVAPSVKPLRAGVYGGETVLPTEPGKGKPQGKVKQSIRDSARGELCTVQIPGSCWGDVIWSHARWLEAGRGKATKAPDIAGAYACLGCDAVYDGQKSPPRGMTREDVDRCWTAGHFRSLVRLAEKGLL